MAEDTAKKKKATYLTGLGGKGGSKEETRDKHALQGHIVSDLFLPSYIASSRLARAI